MARLFVVVCCLGLAVACASPVHLSVQAPATFGSEPKGYEEASVIRIVDGDTIEVRITDVVEGPGAGEGRRGHDYVVRLIGIDTPESVKPGSPVECFGRESSAATKALLLDRQVRLVVDVEERDRYDRLLRYVYMGEEMANARLVANGYAHAYTYPPSVRHAELFLKLEREARDGNRGLWAPGACLG